jgi:hypothetical protein
MTDFNGAGFNTEEKKPGKSLKPGIHVLKVSNVEYFESSQKKTPGIKITLMSKPVDGLLDDNGKNIGQKCTQTWWMSPAAWDVKGAMWCTKAKLTVLADKLGVSDEFANTSAKSAEDFVNKVSKIFTNKAARFVVGGEETSFTNDEGEVIEFIRPELITYKFVESIKDVPNDSDTKLKFDEDKHIKRMEKADDVEADSSFSNTSTNDDDESPW